MSIFAQQRINGSSAKITRPEKVRGADGSVKRAASSEGATVLFEAVHVRFVPLTVERRENVFGSNARATGSIRVPITYALDEGDQVEWLTGPDAGKRFRIEKVLAYRVRPRTTHQECALVEISAGAL